MILCRSLTVLSRLQVRSSPRLVGEGVRLSSPELEMVAVENEPIVPRNLTVPVGKHVVQNAFVEPEDDTRPIVGMARSVEWDALRHVNTVRKGSLSSAFKSISMQITFLAYFILRTYICP